MATSSAEPNLPPSVDEIAARLKQHLEKPEFCNEAKWKNFMDMGVFAFAEFCYERPTQIISVGACTRQQFDTKSRFRTKYELHPGTGARIDTSIYSEELYGSDADKEIAELFCSDNDTIRFCEAGLVPAHRSTAELHQSCAQKKQAHADRGESVLHTIAGQLGLEFITFCSKKRQIMNKRNQIVWLRAHDTTRQVPSAIRTCCSRRLRTSYM